MPDKSNFIKYVADLPSEFSLDDYTDCIEADANWWLTQLSYRATRLAHLRLQYEFDFLTLEEAHKINSLKRKNDKGTLDYSPISMPLVRPIFAIELDEIVQENTSTLPFDPIKACPPELPIAIFEVCTEAADDVLIEEFKKCLSAFRELNPGKGRKKSISENTLRKLSAYKVLPLLDLKIWEIEHNAKIKKSTMAMALFKEGDKADRELSETIIPFAKKATTLKFLNELRFMTPKKSDYFLQQNAEKFPQLISSKKQI